MKRVHEEIDELKKSKIEKSKKSKIDEIIRITKQGKTALVRYFKDFLSQEDADALYDEIYGLRTKYFDRDIINTPKGKVKAPRLTAAFGEKGIQYKYSGFTRQTVNEWPPLLEKCKLQIEKELNVKLNYAFCNIYEVEDENGSTVEHYIGWHSDDEKGIVTTSDGQTTICSISLGDNRKFQLRENYRVGQETPTYIYSYILEHGSLCTMEQHTQQMMKHCVPKKKNATRPRINITFRFMVSDILK